MFIQVYQYTDYVQLGITRATVGIMFPLCCADELVYLTDRDKYHSKEKISSRVFS